MEFTIAPDLPAPGLLLIMDQSGHVLQKKATPGLRFCPLNIGGQTRYTYLENDPNAFRTGGQDQNAGYCVIADSNLNTLQQVNFVPYQDSANIFVTGQSLT